MDTKPRVIRALLILQNRKNALAENPTMGVEKVGENSLQGTLEALKPLATGLDAELDDAFEASKYVANASLYVLSDAMESIDCTNDTDEGAAMLYSILRNVWLDGWIASKVHSQVQAEDERKEEKCYD